jgi:PAS domain S-box-containing protein
VARADRREATEALSRSEAQYRSLVQRAVLGICQAAADGRILSANPALVTMLGYPSAEALCAVSLPDLFVDDGGRAALAGRLRARARFLDDEALWRPKAGEPIRVRLSGACLETSDHGQPVFEFIVEDITEWQRRQDQVWQAQRIEAMGQLAADLAHDFTDPITAILGYAELLTAEVGIEAPGGKHAREIVVAAERAAVLARRLLAVSRTQPIALAPLNLNDVIRGAEATLRRMLGESIQIKTVLANDLGPIMADPLQVEQVLVNLAVKARGAMPAGGVLTIETRTSVREAEFRGMDLGTNPTAFALLRVSDNGAGMASKMLARIDDRFFTTREHGRATGLDLAALSGIVTRIGGAIYIDSEPGRGTSFQIYLRKADRAVRAACVPPPASAPGQETVLLVEDEDSVRSFVRAALARQGYAVLEARSAESALELLDEREEPVHLLLADIVLGGMDGRQLAARVTAEHPFIRTLLMSGYPDRQESGGSGRPGTPVLEKPFAVQVLIQRVREALGTPVAAAR